MQAFKYFFLLVLKFVTTVGEAVPTIKSFEDSSRIIPCKNYFNLSLSITKPIFSATLVNRDDNLSLKYRTVNPFRIGFAFDYRWFGVEVSTQIPTLKAQDTRKGKTDGASFRFSINSRKFWITASYQNYKGFYLDNNQIFYNPLNSENPLPKRPDIQNSVFQFGAFFLFNHHRFSNPAAVGQYERQVRSGGSPFIGFGILRHDLRCSHSLVPNEFQMDFPNLSNTKFISSTNVFASVGYAYTFVWHKKYFIAIYGAPGIGRYQVEEDRGKYGQLKGKGDIGFRLEARSVIGYNGELWYWGGGFFGYWNNEKLLSGNYLNHTYQTLRFFLGRRFSTKKSLGFLGL
ncbi:MAG TPA: DUF4421 family protein [Catalimonadaceae bacterium]|nr:DUF4421 family protein [Catalimonadaceae bacterium]